VDSLRTSLGIAAAILLILLSSWRGSRVKLAGEAEDGSLPPEARRTTRSTTCSLIETRLAPTPLSGGPEGEPLRPRRPAPTPARPRLRPRQGARTPHSTA
jgi:hypothetical protein